MTRSQSLMSFAETLVRMGYVWVCKDIQGYPRPYNKGCSRHRLFMRMDIRRIHQLSMYFLS